MFPGAIRYSIGFWRGDGAMVAIVIRPFYAIAKLILATLERKPARWVQTHP